MARVAQLLVGIVKRVGIAQLRGRSIGHACCVGADVVDQCERPAGLQHAPSGGNKCCGVGEVVRGKPAGDEIEGRVGERQIVRFSVRRLDVGQPARRGKLGGLRQHFIGDVGSDNARDERRQGECRVAGPSCNVEDMPSRLWRNERDEAGKARPAGVHGRGGIVGGGRAELLLHQTAGHDRSSTFCSVAAAAAWRRSP